MLKYIEAQIGFSEVPEEIALCINISGCPVHCAGCHSPHLWEDLGEELKPTVLSNLIAKNSGITCIAFMGGDSYPKEVEALAKWVKENTELKVCWYSGKESPYVTVNYNYFDYIKVGSYKESRGGLDKSTTNQRFYKIEHVIEGGLVFNMLKNITFKFQNNETNNKSEGIN